MFLTGSTRDHCTWWCDSGIQTCTSLWGDGTCTERELPPTRKYHLVKVTGLVPHASYYL